MVQVGLEGDVGFSRHDFRPPHPRRTGVAFSSSSSARLLSPVRDDAAIRLAVYLVRHDVVEQALIVGDHQDRAVGAAQRIDAIGHDPQRVDVQAAGRFRPARGERVQHGHLKHFVALLLAAGNSGSSLDYSGNGLANPFSINGHWSSNPASVFLTGTSAPSRPPLNTAFPSITGTPELGAILTASNGGWDGGGPLTYTYQWQDNGHNVSGATSQTYVPTHGDVGNNIAVVVTATNSLGSA